MGTANPTRRKTRIAVLSVASNSILVALKLVVGGLTGSVSVISEAIHSGVDLVAAVIALLSVRSSGKPADDEHPFGHGKYEDISGAIEAVLIFGAALWILWEATRKLIHPEPLGMVGWAVGVMLLSAVVNAIVSHFLMKVGQETDSIALRADAWHLRTDVYTSAGVMVGLSLVWAHEWLLPNVNLHWLDPVSAMAVAVLILRAAWHLTAESVSHLLDSRLSPAEEKWIRTHIASLHPLVRGFHGLRTRKAGSSRFVEFHLLVNSAMTVADAHRISDQLEESISGNLNGADISIHVEPCDGVCSRKCLQGCLLNDEDRLALQLPAIDSCSDIGLRMRNGPGVN